MELAASLEELGELAWVHYRLRLMVLEHHMSVALELCCMMVLQALEQ